MGVALFLKLRNNIANCLLEYEKGQYANLQHFGIQTLHFFRQLENKEAVKQFVRLYLNN